jgi:rare lipoprotein A
LPSFARVRNLRNGKEVVVRINDRGPYASDRIIDLSSRAADVLDFKRDGTTPVQVTYLGRAPLNGDDGWVTTSRRADEDRRRVAALMAGEGGAATLAPPSHATSTPAQPQQPVQVASAGPLRPGGSTPEHPQAAGPQPLASPPTAYTAQPSVAQSMGALSVQAASFRDRDNAERMRTRLAALGPVGVDPVDVGGITYYRVRMGPFADSAQASSTLDRLAAAGVNGARLVPSY